MTPLRFDIAALAVLFAVGLLLAGCTENVRTTTYGGSQTIKLECGQSLSFATWKISRDTASLWYATRPRKPGEAPTRTTLREKSSFGLIEGTVYFEEC